MSLTKEYSGEWGRCDPQLLKTYSSASWWEHIVGCSACPGCGSRCVRGRGLLIVKLGSFTGGTGRGSVCHQHSWEGEGERVVTEEAGEAGRS